MHVLLLNDVCWSEKTIMFFLLISQCTFCQKEIIEYFNTTIFTVDIHYITDLNKLKLEAHRSMYCSWISSYYYQNCEFEFRSWRGVLDTILCDKVCQWLATGRWFSRDTPVSSINKVDRHEITFNLLFLEQKWRLMGFSVRAANLFWIVLARLLLPIKKIYVNLKNDQRCYCSEKIKLLNMMYFALIGRFPIRGYIDKSFYLFLKMYKSLKLFRKKK